MSGVTISIWPGSGSAVTTSSNSTPFGFYDADTEFQSEAPKVASWCAIRLGYPIQDIEIQDKTFYACFEEAITEYSSQVNQYNAKQNMLRLVGSTTSSNLTHKSVAPSVGAIIKLSEQYGQEVLVGGDIDLRRGYFTTTPYTQSYDLYTAISSSFVSQGFAVPERANIEIKRVFHTAPPAIVRYFDPFAGTGMGTYSMLQEFGWTNYSVATSFMMLPIYADILRLQAIEFNDQVRRSGYGFEVINNKIRIFPVPSDQFNIWFDFILKSDRNDPITNAGGQAMTSGVSDISNVPFNNMVYSQINDIGKQWIRRYTLATAKQTLGGIRAKYATIPIPNSEVTLDGDALKTAGDTERIALIEELRTTLEEMTKRKQLEAEAEEADNLRKTLNSIPLKIYIG
jgi:hypothetical protein